MNAVRIHRRLDSETLHLPELKGMIGRDVEIIVLDEAQPRPRTLDLTQLRSALPGNPFGDDFETTLRAWREQPWNSSDAETGAIRQEWVAGEGSEAHRLR